MANQPTSLSCPPLKQIDGLKKASLTETNGYNKPLLRPYVSTRYVGRGLVDQS